MTINPKKNVSAASHATDISIYKETENCPTKKRYWSVFEKSQIQKAITQYNKDSPEIPFPENPFSYRFSWSCFKKNYLPESSRDCKQIRYQCVNSLFPKARAVISPEDHKVVNQLYDHYIRERSTTPWRTISEDLYNEKNQEFYYSANTLKNFISSQNRKNSKKRKSDSPTEPSKKVHRIQESSSSSSSQAIASSSSSAPLSRPESSPVSVADVPYVSVPLTMTDQEMSALFNEQLPVDGDWPFLDPAAKK
jgi:hypothetical protein